MVNKAIAGAGSVLILGGAIVSTLVTVQENFVHVNVKGITQCTFDEGTPLGALGVLTASFNPGCAEGTNVSETYSRFEPIESGPTTDFWPLFPSQTIFGGILNNSDLTFENCEQFYNDQSVIADMTEKLVIPEVKAGIQQVESELLAGKAALEAGIAQVNAYFPGFFEPVFVPVVGSTLQSILGAVQPGLISLENETSPIELNATLEDALPTLGQEFPALAGIAFNCFDEEATVETFISETRAALDETSDTSSSLCVLRVIQLGLPQEQELAAQLFVFISLVEQACEGDRSFEECYTSQKDDFIKIPDNLLAPWGLCNALTLSTPNFTVPEGQNCSAALLLDFANSNGLIPTDDPEEAEAFAQLVGVLGGCIAEGGEYVEYQNCFDAFIPTELDAFHPAAPPCEPDSDCTRTYGSFINSTDAAALYPILGGCQNFGGATLAGCETFFETASNQYRNNGPLFGLFAPLYAQLSAQGFSNFIDGSTTEERIASCEDDEEDAAAIEQAQLLMPISIGALGLGAIAGFATVCTGKRSLGLIGCVVALAGVALVLVSLLGVQSAPVYSAVGEEVDDGETEYKNGIGSSVLAFIAIGAPAIGAILLGASSCCNNEDDDEAALTSKVDNTY